MRQAPRRLPACGFTLTELLVVMSVIAVLCGLLLPSLAYARFRSKITVCANNYRQWGIAVALYASDDGKARLPSFALPVDEMTGYGSIEPYWVALPMITNMAPHGVTVPMWFCPAAAGGLKIHRDNFQLRTGRELSTPADLAEEFALGQKAVFAFPGLFWWVPRKLGDSSVQFPDPKLMKTRVPDAWPSRLDDSTVSTMPILTDWTVGEWDDDRRTVQITGGNHSWPARVGPVKSSNSGFADGHVETRLRNKLQWQVEGRRSWVYIY